MTLPGAAYGVFRLRHGTYLTAPDGRVQPGITKRLFLS